MDFDPWLLFSGLLIGLIGTGVFIFGKKESNIKCLGAGVLLCVFPYFVHSIIPTDTHADFSARANVNLNATCNAYYDGSSTNYFLPGGGCVNTCYSTVVNHEFGHWMNDLYGTGNGPDGMGEGVGRSEDACQPADP